MSRRRAWILLVVAALASVVAGGARSASDDGRIVFVTDLSPAALILGGRVGASRLHAFSAADGSRVDLSGPIADISDHGAAVSPDRRRIAFLRGGAVWVMNTDGSERRLLLAPEPDEELLDESFDRLVAWSPDSRRLALSAVSVARCLPGYTKCADWYVVVVDLAGRRQTVAGQARNPVWSPDGRLLLVEQGLFSLEEPTDWSLTVVSSDGGGALFSVSNRNCWAAGGWSADASRLLLEQMCGSRARIHVIDTRTWKRRAVLRGFEPDWSADGSQFAYLASDGRRLFSATRDGRQPREVATRVDNWSWAPVGARLAYLRSARGHSELRVVGAGGQRARGVGLAAGKGGFYWDWSPDGRRLAILRSHDRRHDLLSVRRDGRQKVWLARWNGSLGAVAWSPNARRLLLATVRGEAERLDVFRATGGTACVIFQDLPGGHDAVVGWDAAGNQVIVQRVIERNEYQRRVFIMRPDGSEARQLLVGKEALGPAWSPDGAKVAFWRLQPATRRRRASSGIYTVGADGTGRRMVIGGSGAYVRDPAWSPDGSQLAFVRVEANGSDIYTVDAYGGTARRLTAVRHASQPAWSPDGRLIAFHHSVLGIVLVAPDGAGVPRVVPDTVYCSDPAWSPDSRRLVLGCLTGLVLIDPAGAERQLLVPRDESSTPVHPSWSPDGGRIVYATTDGRLAVIPAAGGQPTSIAPPGSRNAEPQWGR